MGQANANSNAGSTAPHKLVEKDGKKGTVHSGGFRSHYSNDSGIT